MQNLYDLLGVRPDDDAESLRKAYHKAAKASHPDHHGGDPEAAARFRRIAQAYDILRDTAKRAAYDRILEVQRKPLRAKLKRALTGLKRHLVTDAIIGVVLTIALVGGYELLAHKPDTPIRETDGMTAREPAGQRSEAGRGRLAGETAPQMPILIPVVSGEAGSAANGRGAAEAAKGPIVPDAAVQTIEVITGDSESDAVIEPAVATAGVGDPGKNQAGEPPDPHTAPSGDAQFAPEKPNSAPRPPSSGVAASDVKHDGKTPESAGGIIAGDAKRAAEIRGATRPPVAARRRHSLEQASLESRNAPESGIAPDNRNALESRSAMGCPGSPACAGDRPHGHPPPLFGVGF